MKNLLLVVILRSERPIGDSRMLISIAQLVFPQLYSARKFVRTIDEKVYLKYVKATTERTQIQSMTIRSALSSFPLRCIGESGTFIIALKC